MVGNDFKGIYLYHQSVCRDHVKVDIVQKTQKVGLILRIQKPTNNRKFKIYNHLFWSMFDRLHWGWIGLICQSVHNYVIGNDSKGMYFFHQYICWDHVKVDIVQKPVKNFSHFLPIVVAIFFSPHQSCLEIWMMFPYTTYFDYV